MFFAPKAMGFFQAALDEGFAKPGARRSAADFEVLASVPVVIDDDLEAAADKMRPSVALYAGGMGAKEANFHFDVICRLGYEAEATKIQELYLAGHQADAIAAVPTKMVEDIALVGPKEKVRDDLEAYRESMLTSMLISGNAQTLRTMAELVG